MSLPRVFGTRPDTIPGDVPYLKADAALAEVWKQRLEPHRGKLTVGLVWASGLGNRSRAPSPSALAPLAAATEHGVKFVSLQKGPAAQDPPPGLDLIDWTSELHDMADTAALIENLDLVVTVDTSVAHLVGAMAKPGLVLLNTPPDWRWLLDRADSPWYPTLRLFRQPSPGDWSGAIARLTEELLSIASGNESERTA